MGRTYYWSTDYVQLNLPGVTSRFLFFRFRRSFEVKKPAPTVEATSGRSYFCLWPNITDYTDSNFHEIRCNSSLQVGWACVSWKLDQWQSFFTYRFQWISNRTFHISWQIWVKFDTGYHQLMTFSTSEIRHRKSPLNNVQQRLNSIRVINT
jgi:hypothetical protein